MQHFFDVLLFTTMFLSTFNFSTTFTPPKSTKDLSQKLQRFAVLHDSDETYISLFARPSFNFLFVKKIDSNAVLRIQSYDRNCMDSIWVDGRNIKIEFLFESGSKIIIKNGIHYRKFEVTTNCGEYGPMDFYRNIGEIKVNNYIDLMDLCSNQYKKIGGNYEAVEVRIQTGVKCEFVMVLEKDTYISDISNPNFNHPSGIIFVKSNSTVPEKFKDYINFNETSNEVEMDLYQTLPEKFGFVGEKYFGIPSFRFNFDKTCDSILTYLQFFDNPKCMATVYLTSKGNSVFETSYGTLTIPQEELSKTKFFADFGMIYSVSESHYTPEFKSILLCEIYPSENVPYFNITKVQSNSKCTKPKIIFGGSSTENITLAFLPVKVVKEPESPWLASLPYVAIVCLLLLLAIAAFVVYFCVRRRRKNQKLKLEKQKQKDQQKLLSKLPTVEDEKELEANTLSQIIEKEIEDEEKGEIQPEPPKPFKVIVPAVIENDDSPTKPLSTPAKK